MKAKNRLGQGGAKNGGDDGGRNGARGMIRKRASKGGLAARAKTAASASVGNGTIAGGGGKK